MKKKNENRYIFLQSSCRAQQIFSQIVCRKIIKEHIINCEYEQDQQFYTFHKFCKVYAAITEPPSSQILCF